MEQEMKVSIAVVRRLRTERGWTQEQLAAASGLSLRTIQRVEAEGTASVGTRMSLAATFGVALGQLSEELHRGKPDPRLPAVGLLVVGMAVLGCVLISESGRLPGLPTSDVLAALNVLLGAIGCMLAIPAAVRLLAQRHYAGVALVILGTPLVLLLAGGLLVGAMVGRAPMWQLGVLGMGGVALVVMALRQFRQTARPSQP